ncbi:MAG: hypothetical protein WDM90_13295 [Ferruginibacter sp.]
MKLYNTTRGIVIEKENNFYLTKEKNWEQFVNDDGLFDKTEKLIQTLSPAGAALITETIAPIGSNQELWACGVTYLRSKVGRQEESKDNGGADFMLKYMKQPGPKFFLNQHHTVLLAINKK